MASRFWISGTGTWDASSTTHWSATSGGSSGAAVPTSNDDVFIDSNSGFGAGGTITLSAVDSLNCKSFLANSGHTYTITGSNVNLRIGLNFTLESGITLGGSGNLYFALDSGSRTVTTAGKIIPYNCNFDAQGGTKWTLQDNLYTSGQFFLDNGEFDSNNKNVTANDFYFYADTDFTPTLTMGSGTWTHIGDDTTNGQIWFIDERNGEVVTINKGTSTIKSFDGLSGTKTFKGGGKTYHNIWIAASSSTGAFILTGSNTFANFKCDNRPQTIKFTNGTTTTVNTFNVTGTAGNLITINSDNTATHALVKTGGGLISCNYLSIQHSVATPANTWYAGNNSTNNQGVASAGSGWNFTTPPQIGFFEFMNRM